MDKVLKLAMIIFVAVIIVSFFLPWVSVESAAMGGVSKLLTGKKQATIDSVSGFDVPILANSEESRFMISIIKLFNPDITDADKKSWLIWGVPGFALIILGLAWYLGNNKWVHLFYGIVGCAIFIGAVYKINTTDLDKLVLQVNIGIGLWATFLGYLGLGFLGLWDFYRLNNAK